MHQEGVTQAVMAGQVKHNKIFSAIRPDGSCQLLFHCRGKNTDALIGAGRAFWRTKAFGWWTRHLFLKPLVPEPGVLTRRAPDAREAADIAYGLGVARQISAWTLGKPWLNFGTARAVAVEAMEGPTETIARAARIAGQAAGGGEGQQSGQDMRFDVPWLVCRPSNT